MVFGDLFSTIKKWSYDELVALLLTYKHDSLRKGVNERFYASKALYCYEYDKSDAFFLGK